MTHLFSRTTRLLLAALTVVALLLSLLPAGQLAAQPANVDPSLAYLDLDSDGQITEIDLMSVTTAWESRKLSGDACSGPAAADVTGDGCVTIADVQTLAANLGVSVLGPSAMAERSRAMVSSDPTFVVTTTSDAPDSNPGDGVCQIAGGGCSLRAAIDESNRMQGANTINFNIPGSGVHVINVTDDDGDGRVFNVLDTTGPTIINGYSQPGASPNTSPTVSNAVIKIYIKGPRVANTSVRNYLSIDGFHVFSGGNEFRGLAFTHLRRSIWLSGHNAHDNIVAGCF
ncbi:MAG TPA: dockerin type I domain-containing protein, partial [Thermomicrobiales bacterium]|nr:dockerin type I domain-containing protein [Thermomicrobiales bacterium]